MTLQCDRATWFGLDDVAIFGGDGVHSEVPDAEIDSLGGYNLHEGKLAKVERFLRCDLEPMASGQKFGGGLDDVLLALAAAEYADAKAGDDPNAFADIGADDDITTFCRATVRVAFDIAGRTMGIDGKWRACRVADGLVANTQVKDRVFDVKLDGRRLALELNDLVRGGERVDRGLQEIMSGVAIEVAVGLGKGNKFGSAPEGIESQRAVFFGQSKVF